MEHKTLNWRRKPNENFETIHFTGMTKKEGSLSSNILVTNYFVFWQTAAL
jgi:hypothetical protein